MGFWKDITRTVRNAFAIRGRNRDQDRGRTMERSSHSANLPGFTPDPVGGVRATGNNPRTKRGGSRMRNNKAANRRKRNRERIARRSRTINRLKAKGKLTHGY
jgi:hypothetical protein